MEKYKLVLLRHGESQWNLENRFTGWTDVGLTKKGMAEAKFSGKILIKEEFKFDLVYTSVLKRAIQTMEICLKEMRINNVPIINDWRLNERHYGALQGLNKSETARKYGDEQVLVWRRSYSTQPPPLDYNDERHPRFDGRYIALTPAQLPASECLKNTFDRFIPFWHETIAHSVRSGKKVLIVAHGNSLRALVKHIDNISDKKIVGLNIPTGVPLVYELDHEMKPIKHYYLGDQKTIAKRMATVAGQGKSR